MDTNEARYEFVDWKTAYIDPLMPFLEYFLAYFQRYAYRAQP